MTSFDPLQTFAGTLHTSTMEKPGTNSALDVKAILPRLALAIAVLGGLLALVVRFGSIIDPATSRAFVVVVASALGLLFLVALFDKDVRYAVDCANRDMKGGSGDDRYFRRPPISLLDPVWGLFGSRLGGTPLRTVRVILIAEFLLMLLVNGRAPTHPALLIAGSAFGITLLLSMIQLKAHYPRRAEAT
jgi:hypothetical protein